MTKKDKKVVTIDADSARKLKTIKGELKSSNEFLDIYESETHIIRVKKDSPRPYKK